MWIAYKSILLADTKMLPTTKLCKTFHHKLLENLIISDLHKVDLQLSTFQTHLPYSVSKVSYLHYPFYVFVGRDILTRQLMWQ